MAKNQKRTEIQVERKNRETLVEHCPFLDEINLECHVAHAQGGVGKRYARLTPSETEKCKTIWKSCPYYVAR
ncbi:MAG: hypothetical protein OEY81_06470 [Candidatus Bathyarchaeota archaeon]|nr:hypothetical protein [Candidatus Bathyarchaeota archaeon]